MKSLARFLLILPLFLLFTYCFPKPAYAEGEFQTDYQVNYQVGTDGKTDVTQNITLTNKTANYYADKFELKIGSTKVTNVKASDDAGNLETKVNFDNNVTTIAVKFNQRVIGEGKKLSWNLSYSSNELATKSGQIWEISIPRLASSQDMGNYNATLAIPRIFGPMAFTTPTPISTQQKSQSQEFAFTKDQLLQSGISMSFGEKQVFAFKLNYYLQNNNVTSQTSTITLPPDNNYQKIVLEKIDPKPQDVTVDEDGNFIAKYKLSPKQKLNITTQGYVEVFSKPFRNIDSLNQDQKNEYLQPQRYWETDNGFIKDKANELKTPKQIYNFVSSYLSYSNDRLAQQTIERKGAAAAIQTPKDSICMEFTDLFIAIARAAKIPAREVEGYAFTQNERLRPLSLTLNSGDVLHAWPEYWDDNLGWVQVDPTWGSTSGGLDYFNKLDFNHITFIQRGISSTDPQPAGAFKDKTKLNQKSVDVSFAEDLPTPTSSVQLQLLTPETIYSGIPTTVTANLINSGSTSIIKQKLTLNSQILSITSQNPLLINLLPPFANRNVKFDVETKGKLNQQRDNLIAGFADSQISKPILIKPIYEIAYSLPFLASLPIAIALLYLGLRFYNKHHKKYRRAQY